MSTLVLVPTTRPNGKVYLPRKPPIADLTYGDYLANGVIVLRTHDIDLARFLARPLWEEEVTDSIDIDTVTAHLNWVHLCPHGPDEFQWVTDEVRGVPSVSFWRPR
jgi:hypothetical protein